MNINLKKEDDKMKKQRFSETEEWNNTAKFAIESGIAKPIEQAFNDYPEDSVDDETSKKIVKRAKKDGYIED